MQDVKRGFMPRFVLNRKCLSVSGACPILVKLFLGKMNMKLRYLFAMLCACPMLAQAEIYKSVDGNGHVTYSSAPIKGGRKLFLEPLPTLVPSGKAHASEQFPTVTNETQKARDDTRRKILQDELNAEVKLLEGAQQNLKGADSNPEVFKGGDGRTYRDATAYEEKIKPLNDQVVLHKQNIEALKTELSRLPK